MISHNTKIYIAGHKGMVGSAIRRRFEKEGFKNLIFRNSSELDLRDQMSVKSFISLQNPDVIIDAAAKVGGILANDQFPWQFLYDNLEMQNNLIASAHQFDVSKFIFLGSSCIYPREAEQPLNEEDLLTDSLEPTNQWYAVAKIAGVKMIEALRRQYGRDYVSLMPTNLYGPDDNFDLKTAHVLPAMIRKFHEAKVEGNKPVEFWGTGSPMREFLHVKDIADAVHFALTNDMEYDLYNVGTGKDITIKNLALLIQDIVGHNGEIQWDPSKPDGTPRKLLDVSRLENAGWSYSIELEDGIRSTYNWFQEHYHEIREVKVQS